MPKINNYESRPPLRSDKLLGTDNPSGQTANFTVGELEDLILGNKGDRQIPINSQLDFTSAEPQFPQDGSRYISTSGGVSNRTSTTVAIHNIYERVESKWVETVPAVGFTVWDLSQGKNFTYTGSSWQAVGVSIGEVIQEVAAASTNIELDYTAHVANELSSYSDASTVNSLISTSTANLASDAALAAMQTTVEGYTDNALTLYSNTAATQGLINGATSGKADSADVVKLNEQFTFTNGNITGTAGTLNTEIAAASANTNQAFAAKVSNLEAMFTLDSSTPQVPTGLSTANLQAVQAVIAGDGYAAATEVTALETEVDANTAGLVTVNNAVATETSARVSAVQSLTTDVAGNTSGLATANTAISDETSARTASLTALQTEVDGNTAGVLSASNAISTETAARANAVTGLTTAVNDNTSTINNVSQAVSTETAARATAVSSLTSTVNSNKSTFDSHVDTYTTETASTASTIEGINTQVGSNTAGVTANTTSISDETTARAAAVSAVEATAAGNTANISTNTSAISTTDGKVDATYSLNVSTDSSNNKVVAGMKLGANNDASYIAFSADSFKVYNGDTTLQSPFEVIGGQVKIKSAAIGTINIGDVAGAPTALQQVTTVYAEDANGTNPSTTRGTRGFVAWYTNINLWTPSAGVSDLDFERIQGTQGIQGIPGTPGTPGNPGTPGIPGADGSSVTIKGTVASVNDLPSSTSTVGDGWIVGNDLHVFVGGTTWNNVGVVRGPIGLQGDPGEDGVGTDGIDGNNGDYVSYVYKVSSTAPSPPAYSSGSFNGTVESIPSGGWTDNPSADINDTEWMSTRRYSHNATTDNWTPGNWSTPARIYQRGIAGNTPVKNIDYFDGEEGAFISFIFKVNSTAPAVPTGGSFNGTGETFPSNWYDEPTANVDDTEWMSRRKYTNTKTYDSSGNETSTWSGGSWSTPVRIYQKGDTGDIGPRGNPGIAIDGDNVRIEYATSANGPWSSVQQANSTYIRSAVQANGTGAYVGGTGTKFVPTLGVEYDNGQPGTSAYIHIKYSDNGTSFSGSNGETVGEWRGIYVDSTEADSNTFSDYKWIKTTGPAGDDGKRLSSGIVFYQYGSENAPSAVNTSAGLSFFFNTGTFGSQLAAQGWNVTSPEMAAGTASNAYWTSHYTVTESSSGSNQGTPVFAAPVRSFAFNQVVTFNSLSTSGSTTIDGDNITSGKLKNSAYSNASGNNFSETGMAIDLDNGSIHAQNFYVNPDGEASFSGVHNGGSIGGWNIGDTAIYSGSTPDADGYAEAGGLTLSSSGGLHSKDFYIDSAGNANFRGSIVIEDDTTIDGAANVDSRILKNRYR